jgi:hypothetical protein
VRLEHHACECYATIRDELAQVVPASAGSAERLHADFDLHARVHTTELDHGHPTATIPPPATGVDLAVKRLVGQQARSAVNGSHYHNGQTR